MKTFLTLLVSLSLVLSAVTASYAMGPLAVSADVIVANVDNTNVGRVCNFTQTRANTGDNFTYGASSFTGTAGAYADVGSGLNSSSTGVYVTNTGSGPVALNLEEHYLPNPSLLPFSVSGGSMNYPWLLGFLFGPGSKAVALDLTYLNVDNFNSGMVGNNVLTNSNTGNNITLGGTSQTGAAVAGSKVTTNLNSNSTGVYVTDSESGPLAANMGTYVYDDVLDANYVPMYFGDLAVALDITNVDVSNFNHGYVFNNVDTNANTGYNFTLGANSGTGGALAGADVSSTVNRNVTTVAVSETGVGPMALNSEENFGVRLNPVFMSGSIAVAGEVNVALVDNTNHGMVLNDVDTNANSAHNLAFGGSSNTGMALSYAVVGSNVNSNTTTVGITDTSSPTAMNSDSQVNTTGGCVPSVGFPCGGSTGGTTAANVGDSGVAVAVDATIASVTNNNTGTVVNNVTTEANTGGNMTKGCGEITCPCDQPNPTESPAPVVTTTSSTGDAVASSEVSNTVNTNTTTVVITK